MKRLFVFLFFLVIASPLSAQFVSPYSDLSDSETVRDLKSHVSFFSSLMLEGRAAGSEGEREAAKYMFQTFSASGVDLLCGDEGDLFGLKSESGDTLTSRNVVALIPGHNKDLREHYIVIGARMDNIGARTMTVNGETREIVFRGANGNASGMAMLLELAKKLSTGANFLGRSVVLVGFGSSSLSYAGSWYFLNRSFSDVGDIDAMIDLDVLGTGNSGFYAYSFSNADINAMIEAQNATLQPVRPEITSRHILNSDNIVFYDKSIPSVLFTTGVTAELGSDRDTPETLDYDMMERELEYLYNFTISLSNGPKPSFNPSESESGKVSDKVVPYYDCDRKPSFLGSTDPRDFLQKWVYQYLKYPQYAQQNGIQGRVLVDFIIDKDGNVTDVQVLRGAHESLDNEAVRVIKASPKWRPGTLAGKPVKSEISLYVEFRLEKKK